MKLGLQTPLSYCHDLYYDCTRIYKFRLKNAIIRLSKPCDDLTDGAFFRLDYDVCSMIYDVCAIIGRVVTVRVRFYLGNLHAIWRITLLIQHRFCNIFSQNNSKNVIYSLCGWHFANSLFVNLKDTERYVSGTAKLLKQYVHF